MESKGGNTGIFVLGTSADEDAYSFTSEAIGTDAILTIPFPHEPFLVFPETLRTAPYEGEGGVVRELEGVWM